MSGGSLDYFYCRVDEIAESIASRATRPEHRAFAKHLASVAVALHDLEWMWSGDTSPGDELSAIRAVVSPAFVARVAADDLAERLDQAREVLAELRRAS